MTQPEGFEYDPHNHRPVPPLSGPPDDWVQEQREAIADGRRPPARLGEYVEHDDGDGTYYLEYIPEDERDQWRNCPYGANPPVPATPEPYSRDLWTPVHLPRIDRWEAELMTFRFGKNRRRILKLIFNAPTGVAELFGPTLVPAIWEALGEWEERTEEDKFDESAYKVLNTALKDLAHHGYINVFTRDGVTLPITHDDEHLQQAYGTDRYGRLPTEWLLAPAQMLNEATPALMRAHRADFHARQTVALTAERIADIPDSELHNRSEYEEEWPHLVSLDPTPRALGGMSALNYAHRDSPRWTVPMVPTEAGKPQQPVHVVARGVPVGGEFHPHAGSIHQVSEIISKSHLRPYLQIESSDDRHIDAMAAIRIEGTKRRGAKTQKYVLEDLLTFLIVIDQMAVLDYIKERLSQSAISQLNQEAFEGLTGVPLILKALDKVPVVQGRQAHVIRQIVLLVSAILQDTVAAWSGQIVEAWPKPEGPPPDED